MFKKVLVIGIGIIFFTPAFSADAASLKVAGWIPWWQAEKGIADAEKHLSDLDTIYPFVYEVDSDGNLIEKSDLGSSDWRTLFRRARRADVEIIPTITWSNGADIASSLGTFRARQRHIEKIIAMVDDGDYDGVNIDYESKLAETKDDFSNFLEEVKNKLGDRILTCTIEPRTPPDSKWRDVPAVIEYANDYEAMNRYCDRVEILAYDQQRIDWKLNDAKSGEPYIPVADVDWVEKVVKLALKDIDSDKIMLGVPTYGREWELTVLPNWYKEYKNIGAINLPDALDLAKQNHATPTQNKAGEQSFTYFPSDSPFHVLSVLPVPDGTSAGNIAAAQALLFANYTGMQVPVRVVWYSDVNAIEDKIRLARKYDLRGMAIFKLDGEEDQKIWNLL